jgi:iron complex outermembrane receptor protein
LQGTYKRGADIKTADYYLANTGIQERNFSATIGYNTAHWGTEAYFSYFDTQLGIFLVRISAILQTYTALIVRPNSDYTPTSASYTINRPNQDLAHNLFKVKSF